VIELSEIAIRENGNISYEESAKEVCEWMIENPQYNVLIIMIHGDIETDLQIHLDNEESVGKNVRNILRKAAKSSNFSLRIGGILHHLGTVRVSYCVLRN